MLIKEFRNQSNPFHQWSLHNKFAKPIFYFPINLPKPHLSQLLQSLKTKQNKKKSCKTFSSISSLPLTHTNTHAVVQFSFALHFCYFPLSPNMHRQSLGSPAAKLHANGVIIVKESSSSPSTSPLSPSLLPSELQKKLPNNDEDEMSPKKSHKTTSSRHHEKLIHLIPILTLLCILVLYLFSHNPSQNGNKIHFSSLRKIISLSFSYNNNFFVFF